MTVPPSAEASMRDTGEPLHVESILDAFRLPDVFELVEQREGSARPGVALAPVGGRPCREN